MYGGEKLCIWPASGTEGRSFTIPGAIPWSRHLLELATQFPGIATRRLLTRPPMLELIFKMLRNNQALQTSNRCHSEINSRILKHELHLKKANSRDEKHFRVHIFLFLPLKPDFRYSSLGFVSLSCSKG